MVRIADAIERAVTLLWGKLIKRGSCGSAKTLEGRGGGGFCDAFEKMAKFHVYTRITGIQFSPLTRRGTCGGGKTPKYAPCMLDVFFLFPPSFLVPSVDSQFALTFAAESG
ncbi:hypothetical protein TraAM80_01417 [Trypanosoma rangeli]|uniref:Uncharacterized protein n=1 Tax=Trypanosoma rangeli TaxID=5698 RepID=A0A422NYZ2_TRYRA|nr:uncharacterized protein TraAM80_01417 [Trypanosoma rangeli]RNF10713.1 hypothetical protein TraAM80_01417 [Trypanosoma rangeli]|eukprot:RNF10713.1 hypothetical protein TraAM80_01417 [Trypanosoma rangeli]